MNIDLEKDESEIFKPSGQKPVSGRKKGAEMQKVTADSIRKMAIRDFQRKQYLEVTKLLVDYIEDSPDDRLAMKLFAFSQLYIGQLKDAEKVFQRLSLSDKSDIESLNAFAYCVLCDGKVQEGLNCLLDAIYVDEQHPRLKENLEKVRVLKDPKFFQSQNRPKDFLFFKLPEPMLIDRVTDTIRDGLKTQAGKIVLAVLIAGTVGLIVFAFYPAITNAMQNFRATRVGQSNYKSLTIKDIDQLQQERAQYKIKMSPEAAKDKIGKIYEYLENKERNKAVVAINELKNSDAPEQLKERAIIMEEFVPDPNQANLGYMPSCADVLKTPFLYRNVYVKWSGKAASVEHKGNKETVFEVYINIIDSTTVEGIVEAHFKDNVEVDNGDDVSLFGYISGLNLDNRIIVFGDKVSKLGK